jgi:hypothetical protein
MTKKAAATIIFFMGIAILIFGGAPRNIGMLVVGSAIVIAAFVLQIKDY